MKYFAYMPKRPPSVVREPVQAYLAPEDATLLARLADASGLSKAEVLRRGIRAFAREQDTVSPMLAFITDQPASHWAPPEPGSVDDRLAQAYGDGAE